MGLTLKSADLVFVDTAPFIYFFEQHPTLYHHMKRLFDMAYDQNIQVATSIITYIEIATYPMRRGFPKLANKYRDYFTHSENINLFPIDLVIAQQTVELRAKHRLNTPDAIQIGTAVACGADYIISNDKSWQKLGPPVPTVLMVGEI